MYIYYASELLARASNPKTAAKPRQAHLANPIRLVIWSAEILSTIWQGTSGGDEGLPVLDSSFRLFARLKSIVDNEESNDDVKDAWSDRKTSLFNGLTSTLRKFGQ